MCDEKIQELISGHLDGCNTPEQEAILREHLATCPVCNQTMQEYQRMQRDMESLRQEAPASLSAGVMDAITKDATPKPRLIKKLPFRYGTAIAAVAAALVLVIGSGKFGLPTSGMVSIHSQSPQVDTVQEETAAKDQMPDQILEDTTISASMAAAEALPANVDCQALAQAQSCIVGVLYGEEPEELAEAEYLSLSGGRQYAMAQEQLLRLSQDFPEMQLYYPDYVSCDAQATAYLIVVQS